MTNNPWNKITSNNKILEIDKNLVEKHNFKYADQEIRKISTIDYPEPFLGNPNANIYILLANPGRDISNEKSTIELVENTELQNIIIKNLHHDFKNIDYPFYFLDPKFEKHPGAKWWKKALKKLIQNDPINQKILANEIFEVELYGYHSTKCERRLINNKNDKLISSEYSYQLIRKAITDNKIILLARAVGDWFDKVPELKNYEKCYFIASNRGIDFSRKTISPKAYLEIERIIEKSRKALAT
jgi:hypothetical protein